MITIVITPHMLKALLPSYYLCACMNATNVGFKRSKEPLKNQISSLAIFVDFTYKEVV